MLFVAFCYVLVLECSMPMLLGNLNSSSSEFVILQNASSLHNQFTTRLCFLLTKIGLYQVLFDRCLSYFVASRRVRFLV